MTHHPAHNWKVGSGRTLPLDQPRLLGILNVTPDSFSDGGSYATIDDAVQAAMRMRAEGASIIDAGGESTRPGSAPVAIEEQIRRTVPVIEGIRRELNSDELMISIDTTQSRVAEAALGAGADIINDVSAGRDDDEMLPLAASRACGVVLMHRRSHPKHDFYSDRYAVAPDYVGDVVGFVRKFLTERCDAAMSAGVARESIVIDPGLGFGKTVEQNHQLIANAAEFINLGFPLLSAASRKSFLAPASATAVPPKERVHASVAVSLMQYQMGVRLFRVHDVAAHQQALAIAAAISIADVQSIASS